MNDREFREFIYLFMGAYEVNGYLLDYEQARKGLGVFQFERYSDSATAVIFHLKMFGSAPSTTEVLAGIKTRKAMESIFGEKYRPLEQSSKKFGGAA